MMTDEIDRLPKAAHDAISPLEAVPGDQTERRVSAATRQALVIPGGVSLRGAKQEE